MTRFLQVFDAEMLHFNISTYLKRMSMKHVHTDVCYVDTKLHANSQYFVTFIDDYSRELWASILKSLQGVPGESQKGDRLEAKF